MAERKHISMEVNFDITDSYPPPEVHAYLFSSGGQMIGIAPVQDGTASFILPAEFDDPNARVFFGISND